MRISYAWLKDFVGLEEPPQAVADALTACGLEVEAIEEQASIPGGLANVVVGLVQEVARHPGADRLQLCLVNVGQEELVQIVCGATNVAKGQKVPVALPGAVLYPTGSAEPITIKAGKIRGELSAGMICAEDELGLSADHAGIMVLDTPLAPGAPAAKALGLESDFLFEIGLTPNRGDAASHLGVARDLAAIYQKEICFPNADFPKNLGPSSLKVAIENPADAVHFHALLFDSIQVGPSPDWLLKRLANLGIATINNVVDITNFISHHLGQPLHAYDADKVAGGSLTVNRAGTKSKLALLDKRTIELSEQDLVIADEAGPVGLAGAMGGTSTSVSDDTTRIILEAACFNPVAVRTTAARHGIKTDASFRFERGVDPALAPGAIALAARLLREHASASLNELPAVALGQELAAKTIFLSIEKLQLLVGQTLPEDRITSILTSLGFTLVATDGGYQVSVPTHRLYDVEGLPDLAEEVIRIFGLNNLELPDRVGIRFFDIEPGWAAFDKQAKIGQILASEGYFELITNSLEALSDKADKEAGLSPVLLLNPLSEELAQMRVSPITATLGALAYNANRRQKALKTFEYGRIYGQKADGTYHERAYLCLAIWGQPDTSWQGKPDAHSYYTLSQTVEKLCQQLGLSVRYGAPSENGLFSSSTALKIAGKEIAMLGQVLPASVKEAGLKGHVFSAVFWWDTVMQVLSSPVFKATEPPRFPEVRRDLSLVIDTQTTYADLHALALKAEKSLLKEVQLFDIFSDSSLGAGKKAYALSFLLASAEATLTDTQIDAAMQRLEKAFVEKAGATIRR